MVAELAADQATVVRTLRVVLALAAEAYDQPTADLLTQRMQVHEKMASRLRAMRAGPRRAGRRSGAGAAQGGLRPAASSAPWSSRNGVLPKASASRPPRRRIEARSGSQ